MAWAFAYPMISAVVCMVIFMMFVNMVFMEKKVKMESRSHLGPGQVRRKWHAKVRCETSNDRPDLHDVVHGGHGNGCT